jgi:hypothetical protein
MSKSISPGEQAAFSEGTFPIDVRTDLAGARASMSVAIKRDPNTHGIGEKRRLSNETLLAIAAAFPLEQGDSIFIGGIRRGGWKSEGATICWTGDRAREITVTRATVHPNQSKHRKVCLCCDNGIFSVDCRLDEATDARWVRIMVDDFRRYKRLAAAGPDIDEDGLIRIPIGLPRADGTFYEYPIELIYRPRLCAWSERGWNYPRFSISGMMNRFPEAAALARGFFDRLPPRQKARALAMAMAA